MQLRFPDIVSVFLDLLFHPDPLLSCRFACVLLNVLLAKRWIIVLTCLLGGVELIGMPDLLPETLSAIISTAVAAVAALIGLYANKKFKFLRELRAWFKSEVYDQHVKKNQSESIAEIEDVLRSQAATILSVVRPYQEHDPITVETLHSRLVDSGSTNLSLADFQYSLSVLLRQDRLPGIRREHDRLFIHEEHISWKKGVAHTDKMRVAKKAFSFIKSGDIVALDAGTTTLEIAKLIAAAFRDKSISKITVVTSSFLVADAIVTTCSELGLEDHDPMFRLFIIGGRVRLNTMAIVDDNTSVAEDIFHDFDKVLPALGGADIAFAGTNGILKNVGFTTADPGERRAKSSLLNNSRRKFIVCDDQKFGLRQSQVFASFDEGISIITCEGDARYVLKDYAEYFENTTTNIIIC